MPFDPMAEDQDQCACAICHGTQCTDDDPFLLCDGGCNGGAHLKCIGLPVVPTGDWLCGQCSLVVWRDALVVYAEGKQCACKKSCSDKALMLAGPARARQGTVGHGGRCGKLVQTHFKGGFRG